MTTWSSANHPLNNTSYATITSSIGGAVGSGQVLTTAGANGTSWTTITPTFNSTNQKSLLTIPYGEDKVVLSEEATLDVKGTVKINGIDLEERLNVIERVLGIPERDATMEAKYPSLKKKFDDYINSLEKYRTFERLKGDT